MDNTQFIKTVVENVDKLNNLFPTTPYGETEEHLVELSGVGITPLEAWVEVSFGDISALLYLEVPNGPDENRTVVVSCRDEYLWKGSNVPATKEEFVNLLSRRDLL